MKKLAEVKRVFDRFAVDGMLTANEALQALTEAGCTAPRTHAGRYLRSRRFFGLRREVREKLRLIWPAAQSMAWHAWHRGLAYAVVNLRGYPNAVATLCYE